MFLAEFPIFSLILGLIYAKIASKFDVLFHDFSRLEGRDKGGMKSCVFHG